ncbi:hypothetical protein [Paenibacillus prosopidis]|uniref:Lipoprotein n=1 Tax=Paenibacillus prosopidis TaxID=630520 RepID=A0A368VMZ8_9BACL|nr:hypothetical protein [Paenibacillus prosopidis]RCW42375.1 hypothetical protein DFP97_11799 [Paenibacillus prosopidis]
MKKKALSLACAIGLSTMLLAGCGITDTNRNTPGNNNGFTTRGTNQGFLLAERDRISNTAEDARMRHLRGTGNTGNGGVNRSNITGYGVNGTTGLYGNEGTGIGGRTGTMTSTANALLIGDVLIVAGDGSDNRGRSGVMGTANDTDGTTGITNGTTGNGGFGGTTGIANGTTGNEGLGGTTGMSNQAMGNASRRVWQVTDKGAIKALNRLQYNLNSMNPSTKATEIGRDLSFLLKHVNPAGQGTGMTDAGTTTNHMGGSTR